MQRRDAETKTLIAEVREEMRDRDAANKVIISDLRSEVRDRHSETRSSIATLNAQGEKHKTDIIKWVVSTALGVAAAAAAITIAVSRAFS